MRQASPPSSIRQVRSDLCMTGAEERRDGHGYGHGHGHGHGYGYGDPADVWRCPAGAWVPTYRAAIHARPRCRPELSSRKIGFGRVAAGSVGPRCALPSPSDRVRPTELGRSQCFQGRHPRAARALLQNSRVGEYGHRPGLYERRDQSPHGVHAERQGTLFTRDPRAT